MKYYYEMLNLPLNSDDFITSLKASLDQHLQKLNDNITANDKVKMQEQNGGKIKLLPSEKKVMLIHMVKVILDLVQKLIIESIHLNREIKQEWINSKEAVQILCS